MRLYEFILMEARAEALASKYEAKILARAKQDHSAEVTEVLPFLQNLEMQFKKYVEWVLLKWLQGNFLIEDLPRVHEVISEFEQKKRGLEKKDINQYKTYLELRNAVVDAEEVKSRRQSAKDARHNDFRVIVDNNRILLGQILSKEAAIEYGRGTEWCTAYTKSSNRFDYYNSQGPVYYLYNKLANEKYQIHYESGQCMDANDMSYSYQKLLKIAPELNNIEPSSDRILNMVQSGQCNLVAYIQTYRNGRRWHEMEPYIIKLPNVAIEYALGVLKDRWPAAEPAIMQNPNAAYRYALEVLKDRWPAAEPYILSGPIDIISDYAVYVVKDVWPEAATLLADNDRYNRMLKVIDNPAAIIQPKVDKLKLKYHNLLSNVQSSAYSEQFDFSAELFYLVHDLIKLPAPPILILRYAGELIKYVPILAINMTHACNMTRWKEFDDMPVYLNVAAGNMDPSGIGEEIAEYKFRNFRNAPWPAMENALSGTDEGSEIIRNEYLETIAKLEDKK